MQIEPDDELARLDADEESSPLIRRWLELAKAMIRRESRGEDAPEEPR
jgi:hypothetical protein